MGEILCIPIVFSIGYMKFTFHTPSLLIQLISIRFDPTRMDLPLFSISSLLHVRYYVWYPWKLIIVVYEYPSFFSLRSVTCFEVVFFFKKLVWVDPKEAILNF